MRGSNASRGFLLAGLLPMLAAGMPQAAAAEDARALLAGMTEAMRSGAYEGTLVYQQGDSLDSMSLVHGWIDGREHERINTRTGEPFELIRAGDSVTCVWPGDRRALISQRVGKVAPLRSLTDLTGLPGMYSARLAGQGRVAGRSARVVEIRADDDLRYGYRMWIDPGSHLLLRSDLLAIDGQPLERVLFTEIERLDSVAPSRFEASLEGVDYTLHAGTGDGATAVEKPEWAVADLPAGFHAVSHVRRTMPPNGRMVLQSVYSDGLASVSVFVEPADGESAVLEGGSRMGAVHAYVRDVDGHRITVVGEVPGATVRLIAAAVRRRDAG